MPKYHYHPKDKAYLETNGIRGFCYYDDLIKVSKSLDVESFVEAIPAAYNKMQSQRKAAKIFGVAVSMFIRHAKNLGVKFRPHGGANRPPAETYEGKPCKYGHTTRYVNTRKCQKCAWIANKKYAEGRR